MLKVGIIGVGAMGAKHLENFLDGKIKNAKITALCDANEENINRYKDKLNSEVKCFKTPSELINSGMVDGVIIATPHYSHPTLSKDAFDAGLHVFCEKPAGVYTKNVREMNEAAQKSGKVFQMNFVMRDFNRFKKIKEMIDTGELGEVKRFVWILTDWYRTQAYYNSSTWRATWAGEGGGVLLNQNPHQLDLMQWMFGMPKRVRGFCYFGKNREIEVEDEATAYFEYENGAVGVYMTTVGEFPGTNRLEISGDKGKLVLENEKITFYKLEMSEKEFNKITDTTAGPIPMEEINIDYEDNPVDDCQADMINNWIGAILFDEKLIAPGEEGIKSLAITNAVYLSTWNDDWVNFPFDEDKFLAKLNEKINSSTYVKKEIKEAKGGLNFHS